MRLDHVSYVASHDQISDVVNRIGSQLGTAFIDGGIHPKFGTRNFTAPLLNGQYIEIVCPLDHPATDATPFGKAVKRKADSGGGWLTWVFSVSDISLIEDKFGRKAVEGNRRKPDGTELRWKQIGVNEITEEKDLPFFIQWLVTNHPSSDGKAISKLKNIKIASSERLANSLFKESIDKSLGEYSIEWVDVENNENLNGIISLKFEGPNGIMQID
jgi:Glyoxalase-like domain